MTAVLSTVAMAQALRVWGWRPGTPLGFDGDAYFVLMQVKDILHHGWYWRNSDVGAPFGQNAGWFTDASWIHYLAIRLLNLFSDSAATVSAVYFFIGFPLAALTMYWLCRSVGVGRLGSVVAGVLFSVVPGHQEGFSHLWLASYWVVPLAVWLVLRALTGVPLVAKAGDGPTRGRRQQALLNARTVAIVVVVGLGGVYYVAFTLLLLVCGLVVGALAGRSRRRTITGGVTGLAVLLVCGIALAVSRWQTRADVVTGKTPGTRVYQESDAFAGKLMDLILPWFHHRSGRLAELTLSYGRVTAATFERPAIGLVAAVGVASLLLVGLGALTSRSPRRASPLVGTLCLLTIVALAFYTRGGLGTLTALLVTPQIRTWSRLFVVVALLGLLALGLWLTHLDRTRGRPAAAAVAALALLVGVVDQTNPAFSPPYPQLRAAEGALSEFTGAMERSLPAGCAVFQLPVFPFPEQGPVSGILDYDPLGPYVVSTDLRWSYAAMRGTAEADWQLSLPPAGDPRLVDDLAAAGFCAVEIDTAGYPSPSTAPRTLREQLGPPIATTTSGRLAAYDLRPRAAELLRTAGSAAFLQRGQAVLHRLPPAPAP